MKKLTFLSLAPNRRKYNDVLCKKLDKAGIHYEKLDSKIGWKLVVNNEDHKTAISIMSKISLNNPQY